MFGHVERRIGQRNHLLPAQASRLGRIERPACDADGAGARNALTEVELQCCHRGAQGLGARERFRLPSHHRQQQELLAAPACGKFAWPGVRRHNGRHPTKDRIAGSVPPGVIDRLEMIHVEQEHRAAAGACGVGRSILDRSHQGAPVAKARQRIGQAGALDLRVGLAQRRIAFFQLASALSHLVLEFLDMALDLAPHPECLKRAFHGQAQVLAIKGLDHELVDAGAIDPVDDRGHIHIAGDDDPDGFGGFRPQPFKQLHPRHARHSLVRQDHRRALGGRQAKHQFQRCSTVRCLEYAVVLAEQCPQHAQVGNLVVHHQQTRCSRRRGSRRLRRRQQVFLEQTHGYPLRRKLTMSVHGPAPQWGGAAGNACPRRATIPHRCCRHGP